MKHQRHRWTEPACASQEARDNYDKINWQDGWYDSENKPPADDEAPREVDLDEHTKASENSQPGRSN